MANKIEDIEAKKEILSSEFHQYFFITLDKELNTPTNQTVNVVIPFEKILNTEEDYGLSHFLNFFNDDYSNILITHSDNFNLIHQVECYKEVLFIKLKPYTNKIALHILPKEYDTTDNILFLKGDDEIQKSERYFSPHYIIHNKTGYKKINLYFQDESGDRDPSKKPYIEFDKFDANPKSYFRYENNHWVEEDYENTYGEFWFDIRDRNVSNMQNVQINVGYKYNNSSPTNAIHYTGTMDITNENKTDRCGLIDANYDNIIPNGNSNVITQLQLDESDNVNFPEELSINNNGFTHQSGLHSDNIGKTYHKTIKYYNDEMYSEEFDGVETNFMISEWTDIS